MRERADPQQPMANLKASGRFAAAPWRRLAALYVFDRRIYDRVLADTEIAAFAVPWPRAR